MKKISRNEMCWCGSKKKYKHCHLQQDERLNEMKREGYKIPPRRIIRTEAQINGIRKSGALTTKILDILEDLIKPGITTGHINDIVHDYTIKNQAIPAPLNYRGYPKSCCTSINEVICHGIPDKNRILQQGDIINVDVTCILDGYYADANRMYIVGETSPEAKKLVQVTKDCLNAGIEAVKPFNDTTAIGRAIEPIAKQNNYSVVRDLCGHGVGLSFHDDPQVLHYDSKHKGMVLVPGMVFTIEPMINIGTHECKFLDDGWTVVTGDLKLSAQWEHTLVVTEEGCEILAS